MGFASINLNHLPSLPEITSNDIYLQVFTHRSLYARPAYRFEDSPEDPAPDNEKLEHLGDSVLGFIITTLIRDMYPNILVGPATRIRAMIVKNKTLAAVAVGYKLHESLLADPAQFVSLRASRRIRADTFESYVAGVYLTQGLEVTKTWLIGVFRPLIMEAYYIMRARYYSSTTPSPSELSSSPPLSPIPFNEESDEDSMSVLEDTVNMRNDLESNLTEEVADNEVDTLVVQNESPAPGISFSEAASPTTTAPQLYHIPHGYIMLFNEHVQKNKLVTEWIWEDSIKVTGNMEPFWKVSVKVEGQYVGVGRGRNRKVARNEAALVALNNLGILSTTVTPNSLEG